MDGQILGNELEGASSSPLGGSFRWREQRRDAFDGSFLGVGSMT